MKRLGLCIAAILSVLLSLLAVPACTAQKTAELQYYADAYADHYGVPRALVDAIIEQESSWNPAALSNLGAAGLMQLMPKTAEQYGIRNRYEITGNLSGGVEYLAELTRRFHGELRLAVAAYYCGAGPINKGDWTIETRTLWPMSRPCAGVMSFICAKTDLVVLLFPEDRNETFNFLFVTDGLYQQCVGTADGPNAKAQQ